MSLAILVVDDDPLMLHMLPPHLEELPTRLKVSAVHTALTPDAALERIETLPDGPLVVLSDFNLKAAMNGIQLLEAVAKLRPSAARVLFSGYDRDQIGDLGPPGIVQGFLEKPMRIQEMLAPLAALADEHARA